jgi:class 3 adenylate cyclase/CHASE2 domain-containing sensor protein
VPTPPSSPSASPPRRASHAQRLTRTQWRIGLAITLAMALLQLLGATTTWEYAAFDARSRWFASQNAGPTDRVAVVMIDDSSLETVGRWPWPRGHLATVIDELRRAGASVVALDLLFDEPQAIELRRADAGVIEVDNDALLAASMAAHGRVVQAVSFNNIDAGALGSSTAGESERRKAPFERVIDAVAADPAISLGALRVAIIPDAPPAGMEMDDLARKAAAARELVVRAGTISIPMANAGAKDARAAWPRSNDPGMPVPAIASAAALVASASFGDGDLDGSVRRLPLWIQVRERLHPTLALAACALHLGVSLSDLAVTPFETAVTTPGGTVRIPAHAAMLRGLRAQGPLVGLAYVPWPRGGDGSWMRQFAIAAQDAQPGEHAALTPGEISMGWILGPTRTIAPAIRANLASLDGPMIALGEKLGLIADLAAYRDRAAKLLTLEPGSPEWEQVFAPQQAAWTTAMEEAAALLEMSAGVDRATLPEAERIDLENLEAIAGDAPRSAISAIRDGATRIAEFRTTQLPARVKDRIVFVGWSATGAIADFARTPIHPRTPGVLVHAALANALLASQDRPQFVREAPVWANLLVVALLGFVGTLVAVRTSVLASPLVLLAAAAAWIAIDGVALWDYGNWSMALVGPLAAAGASWVAVILHRLLVEQRGRKQTEARFRSYVSPEVVDILVGDPSLSSMVPVRRELTIFFSDIANWTTLAEKLGTEGIGVFLATYLKAMTDILQARRATIDKYLGDGIMAFWGAPVEDQHHARRAVEAVIEMQETLERMNAAGDFGPAGAITVRIGLAAGEVNVGDFGNPPHKSAYTVIGDAANLAARLESANKQFGSLILMSDRVKRLMETDLPVRLMGRVVVKGKTEPETLWEPVGSRTPRGPRTAEWITATNNAVEAYIRGDFAASRAGFDALEREFAERTLAELYRHSMDAVEEAGGPGAGFDGSIVLKDK